MRKVSTLLTISRKPALPSVSRMAATGVLALTGLFLLHGNEVSADEFCTSDETRYVEKIAAGMQQYAPMVTKTGNFAAKNESAGDGIGFLVVSFSDRGKTLFIHRFQDEQLDATTMRPGKTKSGDPGFTVYLRQGQLGSCEYAVIVRDRKFVIASRKFQPSRR